MWYELMNKTLLFRVSFAADVTEKSVDLSSDMRLNVEDMKPSILKKPLRRERESRVKELRQNEAPSL